MECIHVFPLLAISTVCYFRKQNTRFQHKTGCIEIPPVRRIVGKNTQLLIKTNIYVILYYHDMKVYFCRVFWCITALELKTYIYMAWQA